MSNNAKTSDARFFFLALVTGVLYHRQRNVWSSYVLHFLLAFLPRCFGLK